MTSQDTKNKNNSILKSSYIVGSMTFISRISGFIRDIIFANIFGASSNTDAFFVAFRIPNTFRRLFSEGTFNAAFVPSYSSLLNNKKKSQAFANSIFNLLILGLFFLVLLI